MSVVIPRMRAACRHGFVDRTGWNAKPPTSNPGWLDDLRGIVVHYTGAAHYMKANHKDCYDQMRLIQQFHQTRPENPAKKQSDFQYQYAVCAHGYVFEGRVPGVKGGANGTRETNATLASVLAMIGTDETPTPEMLEGLLDVINTWRPLSPTGVFRVWGHQELKPTGCPGEHLMAWIRTGTPEPRPVLDTPDPPPSPQEPDMTMMLLATARRVRVKGTLSVYLVGYGGPALHLSPELNDDYEAIGVPLVVVEPHDQLVQSLVMQSGAAPVKEL